MWRSIARSKLIAARNFGAIRQNPTKVQSFSKTLLTQSQTQLVFTESSSIIRNQNLRFLSQVSSPADPNDSDSPHFDFVSTQNYSSVENDMTLMNNDSEISVDVDENNDAILETSGLSDEKFDPEVFVIDVDKFESVLSLLQSRVEGSLESSLDAITDLHLHEEFVATVLKVPLLIGENLIAFVKWAMEKPEFKLTTSVVDQLVRAICRELRKKDAYALWDLIKEIGEKDKGLLNADILNELISVFSKLGKGKAAVEVLDKFEDLGCLPNAETYYLTIEALCRRSFFDWAWSVSEKMLDSERLPETDKVSKIIAWFCKGNKAKEAHSVYIFAKEKRKHASRSSLNFLIFSLCKKDESVKLALEMLDDFSGDAQKYAVNSFATVVHALCRMKEVDEAATLVSKMIRDGPPPGNAVFNAIVNGYSKSGDLEKAKEMIKLMESRGLKPDVYTYTVVMSGYANGGQMKEAIKLLSVAKKKHLKLSTVTYHSLIRGYCKLEEYDNALKLLAEMKDFGVQPTVDEYNKLIQTLCVKALDWGTAEALFEEMKEKGLRIDSKTRALIRAVKELEGEESGNTEESVQA
ncbi:small ribosomal subunit protein mS80 (rPPR6)-like [Rutidosis leptorrhynchoides]|uniref:small ribosomal subunit protein mS80 (rPPR6)-like n=1 Tax=Rutidosis leptorrhynchoides TaxID=125765 RepID=UPI003A9A3F62